MPLFVNMLCIFDATSPFSIYISFNVRGNFRSLSCLCHYYSCSPNRCKHSQQAHRTLHCPRSLYTIETRNSQHHTPHTSSRSDDAQTTKSISSAQCFSIHLSVLFVSLNGESQSLEGGRVRARHRSEKESATARSRTRAACPRARRASCLSWASCGDKLRPRTRRSCSTGLDACP